MNLWPQKKLFAARRRRRRQRFGFLAVLVLVLVAGAVPHGLRFGRRPGDGAAALRGTGPGRSLRRSRGYCGRPRAAVPRSPSRPPPPRRRRAQPTGLSPPRCQAWDLRASRLSPAAGWIRRGPPCASRRRGEQALLRLRRARQDGRWEAKKSLRADEADYAKTRWSPWRGAQGPPAVPLPRERVRRGRPEPKQEKVDELPEAGPADSAAGASRRGRARRRARARRNALEAAAGRIEDYDGVAGVYVRDLEGFRLRGAP